MGLNRDEHAPAHCDSGTHAVAWVRAGEARIPRPLTRAQIETIRANVKYLKALREQERACEGAAGGRMPTSAGDSGGDSAGTAPEAPGKGRCAPSVPGIAKT